MIGARLRPPADDCQSPFAWLWLWRRRAARARSTLARTFPTGSCRSTSGTRSSSTTTPRSTTGWESTRSCLRTAGDRLWPESSAPQRLLAGYQRQRERMERLVVRCAFERAEEYSGDDHHEHGQAAHAANGRTIDHTMANNSAGASLIVNLSRQLSLPWRPVVVLADTQMTDVADAYLIDHSVVQRVVVVAALGSYVAPNGVMARPNGELDPWADWIVAQRFQYVQVSAFYDQTTDVTTAQLPSLPSNPLGAEMAMKQPNIFTITTAADQVSVLAVALPAFVGCGTTSGPRHHGLVRFQSRGRRWCRPRTAMSGSSLRSPRHSPRAPSGRCCSIFSAADRQLAGHTRST